MICVFIINYLGIYALYWDHTNRYIRTVTNINNLEILISCPSDPLHRPLADLHLYHLLIYNFFLLIAGHLWQLLFPQNSPLSDLRTLRWTLTRPLSRFL